MTNNKHELVKLSEANLNLGPFLLGKRVKVDNKRSYTISDRIFKNYLTVSNLDFNSLYFSNKKMLDQLNASQHSDYHKLINKKDKKTHFDSFKNIIQNNTASNYFFTTLEERYRLTDMIPDSVYDHTETITGRMKIKKGTNFLTMKKKDRENIDIELGNRLLEIDVKSCEPALLHAVIYDETPQDIYSYFGSDNIDRQKVKIAVISSLYGSSVARVQKLTGMPKKDLLKIHDHFQIKNIVKKIKNEYHEKGFFYNLYGRPVYSIASPLNYWLQSSAADYCCLAFLNLVDRFKVNLVACIHDAILVEISDKQFNLLKNIKYIKEDYTNIKLRIEHTLIK